MSGSATRPAPPPATTISASSRSFGATTRRPTPVPAIPRHVRAARRSGPRRHRLPRARQPRAGSGDYPDAERGTGNPWRWRERLGTRRRRHRLPRVGILAQRGVTTRTLNAGTGNPWRCRAARRPGPRRPQLRPRSRHPGAASGRLPGGRRPVPADPATCASGSATRPAPPPPPVNSGSCDLHNFATRKPSRFMSRL